MSTSYQIVLNGAMRDRNPQEVATRLAALFKVPVEKVWPLLAKQGMPVRRGLDLQTAARYQAALEQAGCNALVVPEERPAEVGAPSVSAAALSAQRPSTEPVPAARVDAEPEPANGVQTVSDAWTLAGAWQRAAAWQKAFVVGLLLVAGGSLALKLGSGAAGYGQLGDEALAVFQKRVKTAGLCAVRDPRIKSATTGTMSEPFPGMRRTLPAIVAQIEFECVNPALATTKRDDTWWVSLAVDEEYKVARCIRVGGEQHAKASAQDCGFVAAGRVPGGS